MAVENQTFSIDDLIRQAQAPTQESGLRRFLSALAPALIGYQNPQAGLAAIEQLQKVQQQKQSQQMGQSIGQIGQQIMAAGQQDPAQGAALADRAALHFSTVKGFEGAAKQFTTLGDRFREQATARAVAGATDPTSRLNQLTSSGIPLDIAFKIVNTELQNRKLSVVGDKLILTDIVSGQPRVIGTVGTDGKIQPLGGGAVAVTPGRPGTIPEAGQPTPAPGEIQERPISQPPAGFNPVGQLGEASVFQIPGGGKPLTPTGSFTNVMLEVGTGAPYHLSPQEITALFSSPDPNDRVTVATLLQETAEVTQRRDQARIQAEAMARAQADKLVREGTTLSEFTVLNPSFGKVYSTETLEPLPGSATFGQANRLVASGKAVGVNRKTAEEIAAIDESLVNLKDARRLGLKLLTEDTAFRNALRAGRIQFDEAFTGANPEQRRVLAQFRTLISDAFSLARARGGDARISDVDAARVDVVFGVDPDSLLRSAFQTPVAFEARLDRMVRLAENIKRKKLGLAPLPEDTTPIPGVDEAVKKFIGGGQ